MSDLAIKPRIRVKAGRRSPGVQALGGAYDAASFSAPELRGWHTTDQPADHDIAYEHRAVAARARDMARNDGLIAGNVESKLDRAIGAGLTLQSAPRAEVLGLSAQEAQAKGREIEAIWEEWCRDPVACDVRGELECGGLLRQATWQYLVEGEALLLPLWQPTRQARRGSRFATTVQTVDPARLCNPETVSNTLTIREGVEIDRFGAPVAYHIRARHPRAHLFSVAGQIFPSARLPKFRADMRPNVIHAFNAQRPGQHRGVSVFAPIIRDLKMSDRYKRAELQAAVVNAVIAAVLETPADGATLEDLFGGLDKYKAYVEEREGETALGVSPGGIIPELPIGQRLNSFATQRPNSVFGEFLNSVVTMSAAAVGETRETFLRDYTRTNFSSARASLAEAWRSILTLRWHIAQRVARPLFEAVLLEAVARGYIDLPRFIQDRRMRLAWMGGDWLGPARGWIDPEKEVKAALMEIEGGLSTRRSYWKDRGRDPDRVLDEMESERAELQRRGVDTTAAGTIAATPRIAAPPEPQEDDE